MLRHTVMALLCAASFAAASHCATASAQQQAYGRQWGGTYSTRDWNRFYHYPFVYYPQNFYSSEYYQSSEDLYNRYPPEMRVPVYNKKWHNMYPEGNMWHSGHHFLLDTF